MILSHRIFLSENLETRTCPPKVQTAIVLNSKCVLSRDLYFQCHLVLNPHPRADKMVLIKSNHLGISMIYFQATNLAVELAVVDIEGKRLSKRPFNVRLELFHLFGDLKKCQL